MRAQALPQRLPERLANMRVSIAVLYLCCMGSALAADNPAAKASDPGIPAAGRWEGSVRLPGEDLRIIVDLDRSKSGAWIGSVVLPMLDVKGAPLTEIALDGSTVRFNIPSVLGEPPDGPARLEGTFQKQAVLSGTFAQGGHHAPFALHRTGPPQVDLPPSNTSIDPSLVGVWRGDYEMGGYARHVTLELSSPPGAPAAAKFDVIGKQAHSLAVDLIRQDEGLLRIESHEFRIVFEGRLQQPDELRGTMEQNAAEAPIVMKRMTPRVK